MNLFEFLFFWVLVVLVIACSTSLANIVGIPTAAAVILIISSLILLLRASTKISSRRLLVLSSLLVVVTFLSIGLARLLGLRQSIFAIPMSAGLVVVAIQSSLVTWRRLSTPNKSKHE